MKKITRISLAILSGLLLAAAWPTKGFTALIFIAFIPLIYLQDSVDVEDKGNKPNIFGLSFFAFLVWNSLTTWWVWNSTAAGAVAMLLLNSMFMASTFWCYHFMRKNIFRNKNGFFILIVVFLAFENLHLNWQLNWPWLNIGNVFSHSHTWVQWYEYTGVAGGTIWVLLRNILIYKLICSICKKKYQNLGQNIALVLLVISLPLIISRVMYDRYEESGDTVEVAVIQPNIDPYTEEFTLSSYEILSRNFDLAEKIITDKTRFVLSPESSIHENIWLDNIEKYLSIKRLRKFSNDNNSLSYVIGASTLGLVPDGEEDDFAARKFYDADKYYYSYNTAFLINDTSDIQIHQKSRLTPGVEMMPSWRVLRPLKNLAINLGGTVGTLKAEEKPQLFEIDSIGIATLICYESVFGGFVTEFVREGASILFVITNDGWWGNTPGHRQHLELSKLRAIENRRSVARSANTGISALINERGDVLKHTNYWEADALCDEITINDKMTFYTRYGDYLYRIGSFLTILLLSFGIVTFISKKQ